MLIRCPVKYWFVARARTRLTRRFIAVVAAAMLVAPVARGSPMAVLRKVTMAAGNVPARTLERSSSKVLDIIFVDKTSTHWEVDAADALADLADTAEDDGASGPVEQGKRAFGHSKDFRTDLPQVVIAMAVTSDGVPVRRGPSRATPTTPRSSAPSKMTWPGGTCTGWCGSPTAGSPPPRTAPTSPAAVGTTSTRRSCGTRTLRPPPPSPARAVAGNLQVKEVHVAPGGHGDGDDGARTQRFVVCYNPEQGDRDATVRVNIVAHLTALIDGSDTWSAQRRDELVGSLKTKPGRRRYLRRTNAGLLRVDAGAIKAEAHLDGKWLLRTSDTTLTPDDLAAAYKQLLQVERGWRDMKGALGLRPVFHYREDRIRAHVQLCWLALLLIRVIENDTGDTWRNIRHELDRMHLVTLSTPDGRVAQRSTTTPGQKTIFTALTLAEPPRFFDFTAGTD